MTRRAGEFAGLSPERQIEQLSAQLAIFADDLAVKLGAEKARSRELEKANQALRESYMSFSMSFAMMVEGYDPDTRTHLDRTLKWATAVSRRLDLPDLEDLTYGFLLHDIGKIAVPPQIIQKPGKLTDAEWKIVRTHPAQGAQILQGNPYLEKAIEVVRGHHEKWDGTGYPYALKGEAIPIGARVFAVADVFDALTTDRPYRKELSWGEAAEIMRSERGKHFDPQVLDIFLDLIATAMEEDESTSGESRPL